MSRSVSIDYSVVVPILNEEDTLPELCRRLHDVIVADGSAWEVVFVNDGSTDRSLQVMHELRGSFPYIKVVDLSRNFGHQPALTAGLQYARGRAVMLMDGDLQDAPEALPDFIRKWKEGYHVVYAIRAKRKESLLKRLAFAGFYWIQTRISSIHTPLNAGIFSLLDRRVVDALRRMPEYNRYLAGLRAYAGFSQTGIEVERGKRFRGEPRMSIRSLVKLALDGMFAFSTLPLRLVFFTGVILSVLSLLVAAFGLYYRFVLGKELFSWAYGLTTAFFFGGIQLISLGIIGEYVGRIYEEVKQRPYFIAKETFGFEDTKQSEDSTPQTARDGNGAYLEPTSK